MSHGNPHRGGLPVGYLSEIGRVEAGAVLCLRLWCDGPEGQASLWNRFAADLRPATGRAALQAFETLFDLWIRHARRPLMRHDVACRCLGADEACFANFVAAASEGDREDALMIATTMVRADVAQLLVALAQQFGLALRRLSMLPEPGTPGPATDTVLH